MKNKEYHTVRTFPKSNQSENHRSRGKIDTPDIYIERLLILLVSRQYYEKKNVSLCEFGNN